MSSRLKKVLEKKGLLNIYCTAGYPKLNDLPIIVNSLHDAGVDMVEIGIPYSDPVADGPTIQHSNAVALKNGITIDLIFEQLKLCNTEIPKIVMTYFNPIFKYGLDRFCTQCKAVGIEAVIIPDLPISIYLSRYKTQFETHGIHPVFLITPETPLKRLQEIDQISCSFIYAVSSSSTTGKSTGIDKTGEYVTGLKSLPVKHPILVGFNIRTAKDLAYVQSHAQGGIIGSAFIQYLGENKETAQACKAFVKHITKK